MANDPHPVPSYRPETIAVSAGRPTDLGQPLNTPIVPASNFLSGAGPEYSRGDGTETVHAFETAIGELEGGTGVAFSSGMAAISAIFDNLAVGARVVVPDDSYQGVTAVVSDGEQRLGWKVLRLPTGDTQRWLDVIGSVDLIWLESPSNPLLEVGDVPAICAAAKAADVLCAVDNTFATPLSQKPLDHGATFSVHSATKFIGGHSDLLSGIVVVAKGADEELDAIRRRRTFGGAFPGALETFLALRGLRTLPLRLEKSQSNAQVLARRLSGHRAVSEVRYPGLPEHPASEVVKRTLAGPGAMVSFETVGNAISADVRLTRLKLIHPATSLGGVESTIERRAKLVGQEHLPPTLLRMSVGCEHLEDLWDDLDQALGGLIER